MSASKYSDTINEQRYSLLEQLVTKLLHVEQGDENFELARDFCVQKAWFNTFPAVNPRETEAFYADLVARLEADSQTTKASALSALTHKLLALKLASAAGVPDLNHNLLQLLASLSDQPLSSSLDLSPDVLDLLFNPAHRLLDEQRHQHQKQGEQASLPGNTQHFQRLLQRGAAAGRAAAADAGSMSDEYDPYGDDSSLSDWDEGEGKQQRQQQQHWGHQPLSADTQPPAPEETLQQSREQHQQEQQQQQQPALTDGRRQPAASTAHGSRPGVEQLPYCCVVPAPQQPLAKLQALRQAHTKGTQAASVPPEQQQLCLSEHYLTQQVLRVLQGLPALGFAVKDARDRRNTHQQGQQANGQQQPGSTDDSSASSGSGSSGGDLSSEQFYGVDPRVSTPHMPSHALHALLKDAAAAGTCHRQMRALVQQLAYGSMVSNSLEVTPCLRALGAALQQQLDSMGCQLADLQRQLQQEHEQRRSSGRADGSRPPQQQQQQGERGLLLRYVRREARPVVARLQLLHCTVFGILRQLSGPPAAVSAGLIDGLAAAVQVASADEAAGPQVVAGAAALLHLLLSSCVPLSRALAQWLWCAEDSVGAFSSGCQQQAGVSVCSSDFFIVRNASRDVAAVHPSFWHKAYGFSTRNTADAAAAAAAACSGAAAHSTRPGAAAAADVCCPAVLAPFVQSIMTAGKSMRLLDYMDQEDLKRSSLCSSGATVGTDAVAFGVAQQQQQRACALPGNSGGSSTLQRQPSTPRRRRPSSCGSRPGSSSTAAAGGAGAAAGQLSRQASFSGRPGIRPASAADADADAGTAAQPGKAGSRKKWDAAPQQPGSPATAAAALYAVDRNAVARRVGLQLAAAAAMAGQQLIEDELPHEFIRSANYVLQQEQELQATAHATMQQHKQYLQHCSGHSAPGSSSAPDLLLERLESVAAALTRPHALATAGTAAQGQQPSLRDALAAARKARAADAAVLGGAGHALECCAAAPRQQQAVQVPTQPPAGEAAAAAEAPTVNADSGCSAQQQDEAAVPQSPPAAPGSPGTPADISPAASPAAGADAGSPDAHQGGGSNDAHSSSSSGLDVVPKLTVWRDQVEAKLTSAHQHLQSIAPWQQQQQQPACSAADDDTHQLSDARHTQQRGSKAAPTRTHASSSSRNWLLQTAATKVPGHLSGSLAELWPLKPVTGLKELAASGTSWLQGAAWPGCDLEWLLQHPPAHLPAVQQLLWSTLVQPVRTRVELVDRQLMSSLMGEWGMLQQLQGLVNAFLITSPSMVEWVEALFSVVETAKLCAPRSRGSGECSTPSPAASKAVSRIGGAGGAGCDSPGVFVGSPGVGAGASAAGQPLPVTVQDLDLCSLEALLQDCILSADPDEVLPDPRALLITLNKEALAELREQQEKRRRALLAAGPPPAAAAVGGAVRQQPAVGLMLCSKEWAGLELQHSGSWQLSLVYTDEQLRFFGQVWRAMLQLRWVRRRVGAQAVAHRSSAAVNDLTARDRLEAAQVAAAVANSSRTRPNSAGSFRQQQAAAFGRQPGDAAGAVLDWLTGKEELLLLQEMNHFLSCWHSYVMDGIRVRAWGRLEEVLLSAKSLDQVHSATQRFFSDMCNLCSMLPRDSRRNNVWDVMRQRLENLLDHALAAAAAAGRLYAARQKLQELQDLPGRGEDVQAWWLELAEARSRLHQAGRLWQAGLGQLLKSWAVLKKNNVAHALDELSDLLDMNSYFRRLERMAALKAAAALAT